MRRIFHETKEDDQQKNDVRSLTNQQDQEKIEHPKDGHGQSASRLVTPTVYSRQPKRERLTKTAEKTTIKD